MNKHIVKAVSTIKAAGVVLAVVAPISAAQAASIANGREIVERTNCAACHGSTLSNPVSPEYPKLAGQYASYTYQAMRQYQIGKANPKFGRDDLIMAAQMQGMSERDLKDIAAYIESLKNKIPQKGDLVLKK